MGSNPIFGDASYAELLYAYALLAEGSQLSDPARLNPRVVQLMVRDLAGELEQAPAAGATPPSDSQG